MASEEKKTSNKPAARADVPKLPNGDSIRLGKEADGLRNGAFAVGVLGLGAAVMTGGGPLGKQFQHSYLTAYMWGLSIAVGALWWVAMQHLFGARWSVVVRRVGELLAQLVQRVEAGTERFDLDDCASVFIKVGQTGVKQSSKVFGRA